MGPGIEDDDHLPIASSVHALERAARRAPVCVDTPRVVGHEVDVLAPREPWALGAGADERPVGVQDVAVPARLVPLHATAIVGIFAALHADLVSVIDEWGAGPREQQHRALPG